MKKIVYIATILLALVSCQSVPENERLISVDPGEIRSNRTTLICEFSGVKCVNCPDAAEEAHRMLGLWPENLVVVEVHPPSNPFCQNAKYDYTCPAADIYYKRFGGSAETGFPTGIINLTGEFTAYSNWSGAFIQAAVEQSTLHLAAEVRYTDESRSLSADVTIANLDTKSQNLHLIGWLTEDSIVGAQRMPDGTTKSNYVHNHILRDTLTQAWGEPVALVASHELHLDYVVPEKYVAEHCNLVLLALRDEEVVQAMQMKIK